MVYELLSNGKENARSGKELCRALDITPRELTAHIERERRAGQPICASCDRQRPGYYLAGSKEEMQAYCGRLWHRAGEIFKTRRACLATLDNLPAEQEADNGREEDQQHESR